MQQVLAGGFVQNVMIANAGLFGPIGQTVLGTAVSTILSGNQVIQSGGVASNTVVARSGARTSRAAAWQLARTS